MASDISTHTLPSGTLLHGLIDSKHMDLRSCGIFTGSIPHAPNQIALQPAYMYVFFCSIASRLHVLVIRSEESYGYMAR